jgi:hypothetical protein
MEKPAHELAWLSRFFAEDTNVRMVVELPDGIDSGAIRSLRGASVGRIATLH